MFSVFFSNRHESLLDALMQRLDERDRAGGPFERVQVVVPSSALRRSIEMARARRAGVCADLVFDYLAQWLWRQIAVLDDDVPATSPYGAAALVWRFFAALAEPWTEAHPRLAHYLNGADGRARFELSTRLARLFDHYLNYRPDWLERWAEGETAAGVGDGRARADEAWQAELWRRIHADDAKIELPFMRFLRRAAKMDDAELARFGWPRAVHVFALPALPPLSLAALRTLARVVDVHLYVFNPCREYWFDIADARRLSWLARRQGELYFDTGNRLLAAWGQQTQTSIDQLYEGEFALADAADFAPNPSDHLLAQLQNAILDLRELEPASVRLAPADRSVELHLCHSRTRELEALHDRLLGLFAAPNPPRPEDIVVLTPDLAACAPLIEAVFGTAPPERFIPWRITGQGSTDENPVARALDWMLALAAGRAPASQMFDLLQQPLVAAHFGFDDDALEQARGWLDGAGIRWGLDEAQARAAGASGTHTVEWGMGRLFLSWAAGDAASSKLFAGHVGAIGAPRGGDGQLLGAFWRYARTLRHLRADLLRPHDAEGWRALLLDALSALVGEAPANAEDMRAVRVAINALADDIAAGLGKRVVELPLEVVHPALAERLDEGARGGVPGGAVTFSALPSLRGVPYRVVCLIGLDRDAFPGHDRADEFDLMAAAPRKGDRQRRRDDRNLFLDLVLAARDVLHLSCVGRSVRDNAELPPSVVVDELLDTLASACAEKPNDPDAFAAARARFIVEHPLQAFSPAYFAADKPDARLTNYRQDFAAALTAHAARTPSPFAVQQVAPNADRDEDDDERDPDAVADPPFFTAPLPPPPEDWRRVDLVRLKRFFNNPCRFLLGERLGLDLWSGEDAIEDVEPLALGRWDHATLASRLLPSLIDGDDDERLPPDDDTLLALARAGGEYPAGALGDGALRRELVLLRGFAARLNAARARPALPAHAVKLDFALDGEVWTLQADFGALRPDGLIYWRYDEPRVRDYLAAWLDHLTLCAAPPVGVECRTRALARESDFFFKPLPPAEARQALEKLLALYRKGLRAPLRFFPKSAWEYCGAEGERGMENARRKWEAGDFPEKEDPAYRLALRGLGDTLDEEFVLTANEVLGALRRFLVDSRLRNL